MTFSQPVDITNSFPDIDVDDENHDGNEDDVTMTDDVLYEEEVEVVWHNPFSDIKIERIGHGRGQGEKVDQSPSSRPAA